MNLFLIGYRCTGKTTVGKRLADRLSWDFVDADAEVVAAAGRPIADLVAREGWPSFRRVESAVMERLCRNDRQVVATGGGVVLAPENVRGMRAVGRVVWLKASPQTIQERMQADTASPDQRPPLIAGRTLSEEIQETLAQRFERYASAADLAIETDQMNAEKVVATVARHLRHWTAVGSETGAIWFESLDFSSGMEPDDREPEA